MPGCSDSIWGVSSFGPSTSWGIHDIPCPGLTFSTPRNRIAFIARRTKVDEHDTTIQSAYKRRTDSNLLQILAGIGVSDDEISGDY